MEGTRLALQSIFGEGCYVNFKCVGSAAEDTRCFQPDEFDYLVIFTGTEKVLTNRSYFNDFIFQATAQGVDALKNKLQLDTYENGLYLVSDQCKAGIYDVIEKEFCNQMQSFWLKKSNLSR